MYEQKPRSFLRFFLILVIRNLSAWQFLQRRVLHSTSFDSIESCGRRGWECGIPRVCQIPEVGGKGGSTSLELVGSLRTPELDTPSRTRRMVSSTFFLEPSGCELGLTLCSASMDARRKRMHIQPLDEVPHGTPKLPPEVESVMKLNEEGCVRVRVAAGTLNLPLVVI
ncbi:hypothetical protein Drorol1_Dr00026452 [Drosera rotundifolia]